MVDESFMSHYSLRSCLGISTLFQRMFNDSIVAEKFSISKTKCGYYINYGLAPFYRDTLINDIKKAPFYTVLFDETLNKILQEEQMDLYIRYWSETENIVKTRYFDSQFLKRPNAENVAKSIEASLSKHKIPKEKKINLEMDGPSTNWLVLQKIAESRSEV